MATYIDDHITMLKWDILVAHLTDIKIHFGASSTTGQIAVDIISMGNCLKEMGRLNGAYAFLAINALLYESHNGRGIMLRRKFHRLRHYMDYPM